jgi:hypothetical protein
MKLLVMTIVAGAVASAGAITAYAQSLNVEAPSNVEAESLPRLPNVFRDCWEPLPSHCIRPPGLLWFGSASTLQREHHATRHHRAHTVFAQ